MNDGHKRLKKLYPLIRDIYNSIELNLGIKRSIRWLIPKVDGGYLFQIDNKLIFPAFVFLRKYITERIIYHYKAAYDWDDQRSQNIDKDTYNLGYGYIHYAMIRSQRPKRALCLGSMYGFIPFMMARACMENKNGNVDFVDAGYDIKKESHRNIHNYGQGFWKKRSSKKHMQYLLDKKYLNIYVMTAEEFSKKYSYKYDYIFLDADHGYKGAKKIFKTFWMRLNEGGFVCLHDIHFKVHAGGIKFEHWKLWRELVKKYPYKFELYNGYSGLGFIQKITKPRKLFVDCMD